MEQRLSSPRQPLAQRLAFGGLFLALGILFPLLFHLLPARSGKFSCPCTSLSSWPEWCSGPRSALRSELLPLAEHPGRQHAAPRPSALYDGRARGIRLGSGGFATARRGCRCLSPWPLRNWPAEPPMGSACFSRGRCCMSRGPRPSRLSPPPSRAGRALWCSGCSFPLLLLAPQKGGARIDRC